MSQALQIPDEVYEAIKEYAAQRGQTPEEAVVSWATSLRQPAESGKDTQPDEDPMIALMRANGHLVDPAAVPPPQATDLPPYGSEEWTRALEALGQEASDALDRMGTSVADLVER